MMNLFSFYWVRHMLSQSGVDISALTDIQQGVTFPNEKVHVTPVHIGKPGRTGEASCFLAQSVYLGGGKPESSG
jgi:hypothetical protein